MAGQVQVYVNGEPEGKPCYLADGDQLLFSMPGMLLSGRARIAEFRLKRCQESIKARYQTERLLRQTIREMASASTLDEAVGIAYRSGELDGEEPR